MTHIMLTAADLYHLVKPGNRPPCSTCREGGRFSGLPSPMPGNGDIIQGDFRGGYSLIAYV